MEPKEYTILPIFNDCLDAFFSNRILSILNEVDDFAKGKIKRPVPRECGKYPQPRWKFLLPKNKIIVMYWEESENLQFFAAMEQDNKIHQELYRKMLLDKNLDH